MNRTTKTLLGTLSLLVATLAFAGTANAQTVAATGCLGDHVKNDRPEENYWNESCTGVWGTCVGSYSSTGHYDSNGEKVTDTSSSNCFGGNLFTVTS